MSSKDYSNKYKYIDMEPNNYQQNEDLLIRAGIDDSYNEPVNSINNKKPVIKRFLIPGIVTGVLVISGFVFLSLNQDKSADASGAVEGSEKLINAVLSSDKEQISQLIAEKSVYKSSGELSVTLQQELQGVKLDTCERADSDVETDIDIVESVTHRVAYVTYVCDGDAENQLKVEFDMRSVVGSQDLAWKLNFIQVRFTQ